jgi:hypothetical protein
MITTRFDFPGFELVRKEDTSTHEVEIGRVALGDEVYIVHMIRKSGLAFVGDFLVAKVFDTKEEKCLWEFPKGFSGFSLLARAGDEEVVVALVGRGRNGKVEEVVTFSSLVNCRPIDIRSKIRLKRLAAEYLGRGYITTKTEQIVVTRDNDRRREEERVARQVAHEARQKARQEVIERVTNRGRVEAYTPDGRKRFGLPVVGQEWHVLSNGTFVVLVESFDDDTHEAGPVVEVFRVEKGRGGRLQKGFASPVSWERPVSVTDATQQQAPQPVDNIVVETAGGEFFEVVVYTTLEDIRGARLRGLNSGAYVTAQDKKREDGRYEIFSVQPEKVQTVGLLKPMS